MTTDHGVDAPSDLDDIAVQTLDGRPTTFGELRAGRIALVVNVASRCGLAPQYEQLEALQKQYGPDSFTVIGVPSNQFLQEKSSAEAISEYCSTTWGVTFPMTEKMRLNGRRAHPLFQELTRTEDASGKAGRVTWNFEKFLVLTDGTVARFRPTTEPRDPVIVGAIEQALGAE